MSHTLHHAPNLTVSSLIERHFEDRRLGDGVIVDKDDVGGGGFAIFQFDAAAQFGGGLFLDKVLDAHTVYFGDMVAGVRQAEDEVAVVGQQEESFAVLVEPADGNDALSYL